MINTDAGMQQNLELIGLMYGVIARQKRDIAPRSFKNYLIMAEGPIEEIRRLKAEIDDYLGIQEAVARAEKEALEFAAAEAQEGQLPLPLPDYRPEINRPLTGESNAVPS